MKTAYLRGAIQKKTVLTPEEIRKYLGGGKQYSDKEIQDIAVITEQLSKQIINLYLAGKLA
ncbi:MAG TPA: hypothetical protein PLW93_01050 [Candidatus Absconditabacterales bacterium]|nr:hypothetical protein [Candidatus Absconditabacterales bacterium]